MRVNKGEFGAAGTVKSFTDVRAQHPVVMNGFPYCSWQQGDEEPTLHCVESVI